MVVSEEVITDSVVAGDVIGSSVVVASCRLVEGVVGSSGARLRHLKKHLDSKKLPITLCGCLLGSFRCG